MKAAVRISEDLQENFILWTERRTLSKSFLPNFAKMLYSSIKRKWKLEGLKGISTQLLTCLTMVRSNYVSTFYVSPLCNHITKFITMLSITIIRGIKVLKMGFELPFSVFLSVPFSIYSIYFTFLFI